jgi:peptidoglycan/xylan/chitin deacetylase (PgdA/CDA1 family)
MLRSLKLSFLRIAKGLGFNSVLLDSASRRRRLLILCYHGISLDDEHEWGPALYLTPALFRERMEALRRMDCAVLPFGDALRRLYAGNLPPRAVTITFDDGGYDLYKVAWPILREYGFPATLYLTTYYTAFNRPVFDVMLSYLLWKARGRSLSWPEFLKAPVRLDEPGREEVRSRVFAQVRERSLSAAQKDGVLGGLAHNLGIDYEALCAMRILHLMTPSEIRELAADGLDVQLHTHRHRVSLQRGLFLKEIEDNRRSISAMSPRPAVHFCYPCGFHLPEFVEYLRSAGVESATTSETGLAGPHSNPYLLPRLLDTSTLTPLEFAAWLSGLARFFPRRALPVTVHPLVD